MKKILFFSLISFLFLFGCKNKIQDIKPEFNYIKDIDITEYISETTGKTYIYTFEDLGLQITTIPSLFTGEHIKRHNNVLYNGHSTVGNDYFAVFYKNTNTPLEEEIIKHHLPLGCTIITGVIENVHGFYPSMKGFYVIYITSQDGNLSPNNKSFDKEFPENMFSIAFFMDPQQPKKYYKFSYGDCAPGPCSIFGNIKFLD